MRCGVYASEIEISDGTSIRLSDSNIWVVTGPNNSGKSTLLREIARDVGVLLEPIKAKGRVVKKIVVATKGNTDQFSAFIHERFKVDTEADTINLRNSPVKLSRIIDSFSHGALHPSIRTEFVDHLTTSQRLSELGSEYHGNNLLLSLMSDEKKEVEISNVFRRAFGIDLVLNRTGGRPSLHIFDRVNCPRIASA